jgi:hypothetical protein
VKTSDLIGPTLDWAVAKCEGKDGDCAIRAGNVWYGRVTSGFVQYRPSTKWAQGGPIIEREKIDTEYNYTSAQWDACTVGDDGACFALGPAPLIAAMRCYVASKLGDEVDIPAEVLP